MAGVGGRLGASAPEIATEVGTGGPGIWEERAGNGQHRPQGRSALWLALRLGGGTEERRRAGRRRDRLCAMRIACLGIGVLTSAAWNDGSFERLGAQVCRERTRLARVLSFLRSTQRVRPFAPSLMLWVRRPPFGGGSKGSFNQRMGRLRHGAGVPGRRPGMFHPPHHPSVSDST